MTNEERRRLDEVLVRFFAEQDAAEVYRPLTFDDIEEEVVRIGATDPSVFILPLRVGVA